MKIEKTECNYQVTECDLKFGEQITLDGDLLIPASVLGKIREEIKEFADETIESSRDYDDYAGIRYCLAIVDKYMKEINGMTQREEIMHAEAVIEQIQHQKEPILKFDEEKKVVFKALKLYIDKLTGADKYCPNCGTKMQE